MLNPAQLAEARRLKETLDLLVKSEGWQLYMKVLKQQEAQLLEDVTTQTDPHKLMRTAGGLAQVRLNITWVERQQKAFALQISQSDVVVAKHTTDKEK